MITNEKWYARLATWQYVVGGLAILAAAVSLAVWQQMNNTSEQSSEKMHPSLINRATLDRLSETTAPIDRTHLASNLTPPTNKWFSGFALQGQPEPGYNYPNSFLPRTDGFEFSLPKVTADKTIITGVHAPDVAVTIADAASYKITYYDELVVELTYYTSNDKPIATVRVASGLPYVYVSAQQDTTIRFSGKAAQEKGRTNIQSNGNFYGVSVSSTENRFSLAKGAHAAFFSAPSKDALEAVAAQAGAAVKSGKVTYARKGSSFTSTFKYSTVNNKPVRFARLPHQQASTSSPVTYQSILGDMTTEVGTEFSFDTPAVPVKDELDISGISDEERNLLVRQLRSDVAVFADKSDTYFGGKQLYRMAQLLAIAEQLKEDELATTARTRLKSELESWLTLGKNEPKSFLYDPSMKGIVGNEASFGSDKEFNDHHFHYGYFIYAAATLAKYDSQFLSTHKDAVNLLVADIANYNSGEKLPLRRSFDPYAGHSWASGTSPFKDGNNQESTSEAINAWVGVSLWARRIDNQALELESDWMLSQEYRTAQMYWLLQEPAPQYLAPYTSPIASIVWGGKREYATFFSNEANAKLAIQLLPLSPTIKRLGKPFAKDIFKGTSVEKIYGDSILMAQSTSTVEDAIKLPDTAVDDGNSRTYMYAYILSKAQ